jgi:putative PEP-CTERM system histidine kinase
MQTDFSLISHLAAALTFFLLAILIASKYLRRDSDRALFLAALVSSVWAGSLVAQNLWGQPPFFVRYLIELLRDTLWIVVLFAIIRDGARSTRPAVRLRRFLNYATQILVSLMVACVALEYFTDWQLIGGKTKLIGQITLSLLGLCLIEQIWRNSVAFGRSSIKYTCIGIAAILFFDFVMYTDALLFGQISAPFWSARGAVNALVVPLFAVNMINTRRQPIEFQLSRNAVFHVGALMFAGVYLLVAAAGGYYVKVMGGSWGDGLQVLLLAVMLTFLAALLTSVRFRTKLMMFISQNFFDYKYDYRDEWLKMTKAFAHLSDDPPLPARVVRILAELVESNSGIIWILDEDGNYTLKTAINLVSPKHTAIDGESDLVRFFNEREWIVDLHEYKTDPISYNLLEIPDAVLKFPDGWLIIPMYLGNQLYGITLIGNSYAKVDLNWENFDLIRVVARQTSNLLAQADAQRRLSRAMQFEAVSKASAFMVHDLKTLIAQLSLLVRNAPKHRDNPEFIDDMIRTTDHAVQKMTNLVDHIRKPQEDTEVAHALDLCQVVVDLAQHHGRNRPAPQLVGSKERVPVLADPEQLRSVLGHLIQNAQDATSPDGEVTLSLKKASDNVVLFIQDSGSGMTEEFIRSRLFKPFESTKGLTGMGIGAYQAREYVRSIGGNIDVTSEPGVGSCISVRLPIARNPAVTESERTQQVTSGIPTAPQVDRI